MELTGRTVFIPGATSGIGLALARRLHTLGNEVVIGGRRTALPAEIAAQTPGIGTVRIDTADPDSIREAAAQVLEEHPDLDMLIAMAGIMQAEDWTDPASQLPVAEAIVTTNLLGPIRLVAAFMEHLLTREEATIMTVSSGLAFAPLRATPTYNATKAAIHMLSESLRLQLAGTGIQVLELEPPAVRTELMPGFEDNPRTLDLDAFADQVMDLLASDPTPTEIQVEAVKALRHAEARGDYPRVVAMLNGDR